MFASGQSFPSQNTPKGELVKNICAVTVTFNEASIVKHSIKSDSLNGLNGYDVIACVCGGVLVLVQPCLCTETGQQTGQGHARKHAH